MYNVTSFSNFAIVKEEPKNDVKTSNIENNIEESRYEQ